MLKDLLDKMDRIKKIIKNYGVYIIIGIVLGLSVIAIIFLKSKKVKEDIPAGEIISIESPFVELSDNFTLNLQGESSEFDKYQMVYKLHKPDLSVARNFIKNFYDLDDRYIANENQLYETFETDTFLYDEDTGVFYVTSQTGLNLDMKINSAKDLDMFFKTYFNIEKIELLETKKQSENSYLYKGFFVKDGIKYGSLYLEGNAFEIRIEGDNRMYSLAILLHDVERGLVPIQKMPTISVDEILKFTKYPMHLMRNSVEERFWEQDILVRSSARLSSLEVKSVDNLYVFMNYDYSYVFPTYKLTGTGKLLDSTKSTYLAEIQVYLCGINPEYLIEKQTEEIELLDPAPE